MITEFPNESCYTHILKCEDHFHLSNVFMAGFGSTPRKSSMMAYGTILDYSNFNLAWEKIQDNYSPDCWKEMSQYWLYQAYLSPIPVLLVGEIYHKLGIPLEELLSTLEKNKGIKDKG